MLCLNMGILHISSHLPILQGMCCIGPEKLGMEQL